MEGRGWLLHLLSSPLGSISRSWQESAELHLTSSDSRLGTFLLTGLDDSDSFPWCERRFVSERSFQGEWLLHRMIYRAFILLVLWVEKGQEPMVEMARESRMWRQLIFSLNSEASYLRRFVLTHCVCVCVHVCFLSCCFRPVVTLYPLFTVCTPRGSPTPASVSVSSCWVLLLQVWVNTWEAFLILIFDLHFEEIWILSKFWHLLIL